jgi:hypothetical protein
MESVVYATRYLIISDETMSNQNIESKIDFNAVSIKKFDYKVTKILEIERL